MIADCVNKYYKSQDGIVIIHGTDTLDYTSSMLSHMLKGIPIPVVITGSQLSIINPVADALENMRIAIYMAKNNYPGVFVAFNRKIMLAKCVSKTHSKSFNAFESINCGNVAEVNSYGIQVDEKLVPKVDPFFRVKSNICDKVFLLKITPGLSPDIIDYLIEKEYKGIIIESYGLGGLPDEEDNDFISKCKEAIEKGIKIIILSQCTYDGVDLNVYETGVKTKEMGIISMPLATKEYAYTRLMWELGNN
jgi:L-asparaginase